MSLATDIADAVAAELAGGTFTMSFTPVRRVLPSYELSDLAELRVTVVPKAVDITAVARTMSQFDVQVDIGIQKKVSDLDGEVARLCGLVDEIADYLRGRKLASAEYAAWVRTENNPIYAPEHLHEKRTFTSVLTLTYRAVK